MQKQNVVAMVGASKLMALAVTLAMSVWIAAPASASMDSDHDGLTNWQERNVTHTRPFDPDSDNDHIKDGDEDSDHDGTDNEDDQQNSANGCAAGVEDDADQDTDDDVDGEDDDQGEGAAQAPLTPRNTFREKRPGDPAVSFALWNRNFRRVK